MTEELKQKAESEADKAVIGSGMDRASVIHLKHLLVTMYMQGATENGRDEQLTKAKELLTRFVMASVYFNGKETDLVEEAEQFLSEAEK